MNDNSSGGGSDVSAVTTTTTVRTIKVREGSPRRRPAAILGWSALAAAPLLTIASLERVPNIEKQLTRKTVEEANALGLSGLTISYSGQDGTVSCATELTSAQRNALRRNVLNRYGVHDVTFDGSCIDRSAATPTSVTPTAAPTTAAPTTAPATTAAPTTVVPTTVAPTTIPPTTTTAALDGQATAIYADGRMVLSGVVASEAQRQAIVNAAASQVDPANIDDQLEVVAGTPLDDAAADGLAALIAAMPDNVVSAEAGWTGSALYTRGVGLDDETRAAYQAVADDVGAVSELSLRPQGNECDVADLTAQLNDVVADSPIQFASNSATVSDESAATLDQVAAIAKECGGISIAVQGHTDSGGSGETNQTLSEARAQAVLDALVDRGVPADQLAAEGFGESELILDANGVEDQARSRRVVFDVAVQ